jgi:septum formation protein
MGCPPGSPCQAGRVPIRRLVLASASPARLALLRAAGLEPEVMVSGVAEDGVEGLSPGESARTLAERKAAAIARRLHGATLPGHPAPLVVGCDSLLTIDGQVRGKPASADQARAWWRDQRGRSGILTTGHAVIDMGNGRRTSGVADTVVHFGSPSDAEIEAYIATGEPLSVAGACTIEGYGAPFVTGIDGSHGTVIGLSLPLLRTLLADLGIAITDLWVHTP